MIVTPTIKPKRRRWKVATDPLDMRHAVEALAREHAERMAGPRAPACRCSRPWPMDAGGEDVRCLRCGRRLAS